MSISSDISTLAVNGESVVSSCGLHPLIAVLTSNGADIICKKNNFISFSDLLAPFSNVSYVIKDPAAVQLSSKVKLDFRDIAKSGCLWSLTVLPSVLDQVVSITAATEPSEDIWSACFRDAFCYWFEPAEHDFFKSYICCLFVISTEDEDPLGELARLTQKQNTQQHGGAESATVLGPAHCSSPKWFLPNILKHYVVLHDVSTGNEENANEIFKKVVQMYGSDCCHLLKLNSETETTDLPDPWHQILEQRYRGLETGLELARKRLIESNNVSNDLSIDRKEDQNSLPIAATFSSSLATPVFSTSSAAAIPATSQYPTSVNLSNSSTKCMNYSIDSSKIYGQYLSTSDREEIRDFVEKFVKNSLVPFVEKQIFAQNDILQNRRGIGKSFTSVRKWLTAASSTPSTTQPVTYGAESTELQTRRLADLSFLFGLYAFAYSLYQSVKKDFANDNAKLHQAGALEMATLSFYLSQTQLSPKQLPLRYLDAALNIYMNECMQPMLALRCSIISIEILLKLSMNLEAANQLILLTSNRTDLGPNTKMLSDLASGILLEKASILFLHGKMYRKRAFHLVLAGHRFSQSGHGTLAFKCYNNAASEYFDKEWIYAEDHIISTLAYNAQDSKFQIDCVNKLIKPNEIKIIDSETQSKYIDYYIKILSKNNVKNIDFPIPLLDNQNITVIYGETPKYVEEDEKSKFCEESLIKWEDLERACFHACAGLKKPFIRECPMFSNYSTKNVSKKESPPYERFRVQFKLLNPLYECLTLKNLKLGIEDIVMREGCSVAEAFQEIGKIDELVLAATELPSINESNQKTIPKISETLVELHVIPTDKVMSFTVKNILFDLSSSDGIAVSGRLLINIKGKRLHKTKEQRLKKLYSNDYRMTTNVSIHPWPLLNIELSGQAARSKTIHAYCSQIFQVMVTLENIGDISIKSITVASDQTEYVSISEPNKNHQTWNLCKTDISTNGVLYHIIDDEHAKLEPKNKLTLRMAIKAPEISIENSDYQILFFYMGDNGYFREYRYNIKITTEPLLNCTSKILNQDLNLCAIDVKNVIPNRDAVLAKVEFIRLKAILTISNEIIKEVDVNLDLVVKRQITIESEQSDIIPFFINKESSNKESSTLWLTDSVYDIPSFNNVFKHQLETGCHLYFLLLWKSHVAGNGNVVTLFGENRIQNPFSLDYLNKYFLNQ